MVAVLRTAKDLSNFTQRRVFRWNHIFDCEGTLMMYSMVRVEIPARNDKECGSYLRGKSCSLRSDFSGHSLTLVPEKRGLRSRSTSITIPPSGGNDLLTVLGK